MSGRDTLITGIGLISAAGEGIAANFTCLCRGGEGFPRPDTETFAPYPVFPMVPLDLTQQIPRRGDQRQMGPWQHFGVYAAGLALADAGLAGDTDRLEQTNLIVAAAGGERDQDADSLILKAIAEADDPDSSMNEALLSELRPTLFLAQLSNLLAGNISIVHHVTGSSRTLMGEELAGTMALQVAHNRISAGQGDLFLVGGAYNAERQDMLVNQALGGMVWDDGNTGVSARLKADGGIVPGSMAAFLVLESRAHAVARKAHRYARLVSVECDSGARGDFDRASARIDNLASKFAKLLREAPVGCISGASGEAVSGQLERRFLDMIGKGVAQNRRSIGSVIGHGFEAESPVGVALAGAALDAETYYPPFDPTGPDASSDTLSPAQILVTSFGHWRGEGAILLQQTD